MEPYVHEKDEGTKKVIIAASGNSNHGLRTRCAKSPSVTSPKRTRNRAKMANGTSNPNVLNGDLMKSSWLQPVSPDKNPLHYAAGSPVHLNPAIHAYETGYSNSKFLSASPDSRAARFNATLFSSATRHLNEGLDVEEAMDIDHQETDDEALKSATQPCSSASVSNDSSPAPSLDNCSSSKCQDDANCTEEQAARTKAPELKDSSSANQKKEASKSVVVGMSKSPLKTKTVSQSKKNRAIYIVVHVSTVRIGELVGKALAPVKIYGEKILIEMETADGNSENKTYNFRIPWKDLAGCKASLSGWPLLILVKPTAFGATSIVGKLKGKEQFLDPESKDINKRYIILVMNYKEIPRDVKSDLIELFQNRLAGQLTWSQLSPNEAQQLLIGREEETSKCSPNWPPKLASPSRPEERKILTPKGKTNRKKLFTDATNAAEAKVSAPRIATRTESSPVGQDRRAPTQVMEELSDCAALQSQTTRGNLPAAPMDTDKPASAGSEPVKPDILLHHKEMESHITLLDQHSKEQRENLEEHQKLLEIERGKLRAIAVENNRHIGRMRDLEISFSTDKLNLLQRIKSLETTLAENDQAITEQTLTITLLREELEQKKTSLRQLQRELSQQSDGNCRLRNLEVELIQARRLLDEEKAIRSMREQQLRDKETMVHELQRNVSEEQQARLRSDSELHRERTSFIQLEERLENERLSRLSIERDLRTKEETIAEHRRLLEQERQEKTAIEDRLRNVQQEMEGERNMRVSSDRELLQERSNLEQCRANLERERAARNQESRNHQRAANESEQRIRDLQVSLSAAQDAVGEYHRLEPRDWIIRRDEVQLSEKSLGVGAWGTVCEGTFRGCQVAVKQIHELILSPHNRRLFEREMSIASRCRHPNLLQFIGATNDDGSPLFITELLDTDLRKILSRRALLQEEIVCIALDVARALNYLHLNKPFPIIHRDISSSNVLLWRRDDSWRAKLSDYGAANFLRQCMTANPGALIYASPESLTSQQSPKADVFSFGLLLCEMCVRELPVPQQIQDQINLVSHGVLRELIMRCVETSPEARPSMSDVISVLLQHTESLRAQGLVSINGRSTAL